MGTAYGGKGFNGTAAVSGDWPIGVASCRPRHTLASCQTPLQTKVTVVGRNEIYDRENLSGPLWVHKLLGPRPSLPPPLPPSSTSLALCQQECVVGLQCVQTSGEHAVSGHVLLGNRRSRGPGDVDCGTGPATARQVSCRDSATQPFISLSR